MGKEEEEEEEKEDIRNGCKIIISVRTAPLSQESQMEEKDRPTGSRAEEVSRTDA